MTTAWQPVHSVTDCHMTITLLLKCIFQVFVKSGDASESLEPLSKVRESPANLSTFSRYLCFRLAMTVVLRHCFLYLTGVFDRNARLSASSWCGGTQRRKFKCFSQRSECPSDTVSQFGRWPDKHGSFSRTLCLICCWFVYFRLSCLSLEQVELGSTNVASSYQSVEINQRPDGSPLFNRSVRRYYIEVLALVAGMIAIKVSVKITVLLCSHLHIPPTLRRQ